MGGGRCAREKQAKKAGEQGPHEAKRVGPGPGDNWEAKRRGPNLQPVEVKRRGVEPSHCQSKSADVHWEPPEQALACAAQGPSNGAGQLKAQGLHGEWAASTTWWAAGGCVCCVLLGPVGHRVGTVPWGCLPGFARPALWPARPGPWPTQRLGSRASTSYPEQGHCHPRGMATHSCPACLVLSWAQATAGSLHETLHQGLLGGARVETWGRSPGAWGRGWQPEARWWGGMVWEHLARHQGRASWVSGVGDTRPRAQHGAPPRAGAGSPPTPPPPPPSLTSTPTRPHRPR